jgi:Ca2+-binding EF-hand superfamily protein
MPKKKKKKEKEDEEEAAPEKAKEPMKLKALEYRLDKAISKYNNVSHENRVLRDKIDHIRRERIQLNQVFKKQIEDIRTTTKSIYSVKTESDEAKNVTEEYKVRISALRKKRDRERKLFSMDVERIKEETKKQDREKKQGEVAMYREAVSARYRRDYMIADEEAEFSEATMMQRILKLAFLNTIQRRHIKQHQKNIEIFEQAFATIKSTTGISDIEEIVRIFVKLEERNFSLLTYVNQLNREMEALEKRNSDLQLSIKEQQQSDEAAELRRRENLSDLELQIQRTQQVTAENNERLAAQQEALADIKPVLWAIAEKIDRENRGTGPLPKEDDLLGVLTWIEKSLGKWRDFVPDREGDKLFKPFPCTVAAQVKQLQAKRWGQPVPLLRPQDLPPANFTVQQDRRDGGESDSSEEDYESKPFPLKELREKTKASIEKRKKKKQLTQEGAEQKADEAKQDEEELEYDDFVKENDEDESDSSASSDSVHADQQNWPTDNEINEIFLKRYKMTKEELQAMADRMGIQLNNLCYLKQEFDAYDEDRSGYIDRAELKGLLEKLGEELSDEELDAAFNELDSDQSGEIEFFEFVEWFTSD